MAATNTSFALPPLPDYSLKPSAPLISWSYGAKTTDAIVQAVLPILGYWIVSLLYHVIDVYDLLAKYRLHTPAEVLKRNHATRYEVFRDVVLQQAMQVVASLSLAYFDEPPMYGKADYDIAWYAQKIRLVQRSIPFVLGTLGLNTTAVASKLAASSPALASALRGGQYPELIQSITVAGQQVMAPAFASWEISIASAMYWYAIPAVQFAAAIVIMDSWEYMMHRAMHMNKWLYVTLHSRHHRLYVPYAYGALYNHPIEGILMDTLGAGLAFLLTGMTIRQSMWFFTGCTIKTVLDHSGYDFPYDPVHFLFPNNAKYHDIHHQSWGIKSNFSQPFFIWWDQYLGTMWEGDTTEKYARQRRAAEHKVAQDNENRARAALTTALKADDSNTRLSSPRITRKKASSISQSSAGNLKGLRNKVNESLHGKRANVLGVESSH